MASPTTHAWDLNNGSRFPKTGKRGNLSVVRKSGSRNVEHASMKLHTNESSLAISTRENNKHVISTAECIVADAMPSFVAWTRAESCGHQID